MGYERDFRERPILPGELWRLLAPAVPWVILGALGVWVVGGAFYTVAPHEQAVVMRVGKYLATMQPGLHFKVPLAERVVNVSVEERSMRLPYANAAPTDSDDDTLMLTGDLNAASVEWTVQWKVSDPAKYVRRIPSSEGDRIAADLLATAARTVMNRLVGDYSFDEVLGPKRGDIAAAARKDTQRILDSYSCGLTVTALQMQRVIPPETVKPAFDRVNASIQEKQKLENEAEASRNQMIPKAKAAKDKLIREAEGFAARRKAEATGEIEALLARYRAYARAPEVTRERLYLETMQEVLQGVKEKVILDSDLKQVLPLLELGAKREGE